MLTMTKRQAIAALFMGVLAKMAHADEPPKDGSGPNQFGANPKGWPAGDGSTFLLMQNPTSWFVNLDAMKDLQITLAGKTVTLTAAEIFAALETP
jgi:hypothetical protein